MAKMRINPKFLRIHIDRINDLKDSDKPDTFEPVVISFNQAAQWLIKLIVESGFTPKVEQLGAGVKRISIVGKCCPTCGEMIKE